jgi:hypothetical protein
MLWRQHRDGTVDVGDISEAKVRMRLELKKKL